MALTDKEKIKIVEEEELRYKARKDIKSRPFRKTLKILIIGGGILILISFVLGHTTLPMSDTYTQNLSVASTQTANKNIDIPRSEVITILSSSGYSFVKAKPTNGIETYEATRQAGKVQLIGPKDNLNSLSYTAYFYNNAVDNSTSAGTDMIMLSTSIDKSSVNWLMQQIDNAHSDLSSPYNSSQVFGNRKFTFIYLPVDTPARSMTLGITAN